MITDDDLLSFNETAQILGISRTALYTIVDERKELEAAATPARGAQRRRYFRRGDVEALKQLRERGEPKV
jgi:hypothetical protein